jgi:hypothetical protein
MENEILDDFEMEFYDDLPIIEHIDWDHQNDDEWYTEVFNQ